MPVEDFFEALLPVVLVFITFLIPLMLVVKFGLRKSRKIRHDSEIRMRLIENHVDLATTKLLLSQWNKESRNSLNFGTLRASFALISCAISIFIIIVFNVQTSYFCYAIVILGFAFGLLLAFAAELLFNHRL